MQVKYSFVCDAANLSQWGTLNVLGIFKNINAPKFPWAHPKFMYVAHIEFHRSEICKHKFRLTFIDDDGKNILPPLDGELDVNPQNLWANIILDLTNVNFPKAGTYQIDLNIDNQHICTESITVTDTSQKEK